MKYLAILKDSFREAIDGKIFYVMVGISCLLTLLISSLSFRQLSMEEELNTFAEEWTKYSSFLYEGAHLKFEVTDFQQLNDAAEPWRGDYHFTLHVHFPDEKVAAAVPKQQLQEKFQDKEDRFRWFENLEVREVKSDDPKEVHFTITTHGTKLSDRRGWPHEPVLFFGALPLRFLHLPLGMQVYLVENYLVNGFGAWIAILVGIVITAFFVPNMLQKGTVDLLLVKPIHRPTLLIYKYIGGLMFVFLNSAVIVLGIWLALGLRTDVWAPGFLLTIFVLTFFFAILYSVSVLFGVLTRNVIVSILMTCLVWFVLWLTGTFYQALDRSKEESQRSDKFPAWVGTTVDTVHFLLPRAKDLDHLTDRLVSRGVLDDFQVKQLKLDDTNFSWGESLTVSGVFIAIMLGLACWRFAIRDY